MIFIEALIDSIIHSYNVSLLYDKDLGEEESEYSTGYFAILVDVVLHACLGANKEVS